MLKTEKLTITANLDFPSFAMLSQKTKMVKALSQLGLKTMEDRGSKRTTTNNKHICFDGILISRKNGNGQGDTAAPLFPIPKQI